jgi:hypothetical protein
MKYLKKIAITMREPDRVDLNRRVRDTLEHTPGTGQENANVEQGTGGGLNTKLDEKRQIVFNDMLGKDFLTSWNMVYNDLQNETKYENVLKCNEAAQNMLNIIDNLTVGREEELNKQLSIFNNNMVSKDGLLNIAKYIIQAIHSLKIVRKIMNNDITTIENANVTDEKTFMEYIDEDSPLAPFKNQLISYFREKGFKPELYQGFKYKYNNLTTSLMGILKSLVGVVERLANTLKTTSEYASLISVINSKIQNEDNPENEIERLKARGNTNILVDQVKQKLNMAKNTMNVQLGIREGDYNRGDSAEREGLRESNTEYTE